MDVRLLRYDVFASPQVNKSSKGFLPKFADKSLTSLLKYKNETIRQPIHTKIFKPYGDDSITAEKMHQLMSTTGKLSYSSSVKNINKCPEVQLDPKAAKFKQSSQNRHYLRSDYQTKRKMKDDKSSQMLQSQSDYLMQNVQLRFCEKSMKSQFKANMIFFKKTRNIPAQIKLLKKEEERKSMGETTKNGFMFEQQRKLKFPQKPQQQHTDHSMFSSTFRDNFLKSQRSNFHPKPQSQEKSVRTGHKKTQSVQTQNQIEEPHKEVPLMYGSDN